MTREFSRGESTEGGVRPVVVVVTRPSSGHLLVLRKALEPVLVQALVPESPVEALASTALHGPPRLDQVVHKALPVPPLVEGPGRELRAVVAHQHSRRPRLRISSSSTRTTRRLGRLKSTSMANLFDTNFFGVVRVIQAALPILRQQGSGHILGTSSVAGVVAGPMIGYYHASKWSFEALYESLSQEVAGFGIKVTLLEPGAYATEFASQASLKVAEPMDSCRPMRQQVFAAGSAIEFGDPHATPDLILRLVDHENPPLRVFLGTEGMPAARAALRHRLATWEAWESMSNQAQGESRRRTVTSF